MLVKSLSLFFVLLISLPAIAQLKDGDEPPNFANDLAKLTPEEQKRWQLDFAIANHNFKRKKIKECLAKLKSLKKRIRSNPAVHNMEGACHVENRNFKLAVFAFRKAHIYDPKNLNVAFNLAEVEFVTKDFKTARVRFEKVRKEFKKRGLAQANLELFSRYKVFLCHLMLKDDERLKKASQTIEQNHPKELIHFYSAAAQAISSKKLDEAKELLKKANETVPEKNEHLNYKDALIELGYMNKQGKLIIPKK